MEAPLRRRLQGQGLLPELQAGSGLISGPLWPRSTPKEKGVDVKVQDQYLRHLRADPLKSEIAKTEAPTLFQVNGPVGYQNWKKYTADMSNTDV